MRWSSIVFLLAACGGSDPPARPDGGGHDARPAVDAPMAMDAPPPDAPAPADAGGLRVATALITGEHRFVPGQMFGGWGPHLGHLVRAGGALYWVDDLCTQGVDCDVTVNHRIGVFRRDGDLWSPLGVTPLPPVVQQNTATISVGDELRTYGIDIRESDVVECRFDVATATTRGCMRLGFETGPSSNYVGAALSPTGTRVVWWTNVLEGGGSFSYLAEYTEGFNGPRSGVLPGYNDCAYVNAAFRSDGPGLTFFGEATTGTAPAWTFSTLVGTADLTTTDPATWANALPPPPGDRVLSTNDVWIDPTTQDTHLLARTESGAAAYYFRPRDGTFAAPQIVDAAALRARWLITMGAIAVVYGPNAGGLRLRSIPRTTITPAVAPDLTATAPAEIPVPPDLGPVLGIYPEAPAYQTEPVAGLHFVVVGTARQNEAIYFEVRR